MNLLYKSNEDRDTEKNKKKCKWTMYNKYSLYQPNSNIQNKLLNKSKKNQCHWRYWLTQVTRVTSFPEKTQCLV